MALTVGLDSVRSAVLRRGAHRPVDERRLCTLSAAGEEAGHDRRAVDLAGPSHLDGGAVGSHDYARI